MTADKPEKIKSVKRLNHCKRNKQFPNRKQHKWAKIQQNKQKDLKAKTWGRNYLNESNHLKNKRRKWSQDQETKFNQKTKTVQTDFLQTSNELKIHFKHQGNRHVAWTSWDNIVFASQSSISIRNPHVWCLNSWWSFNDVLKWQKAALLCSSIRR